MTSITDVYEGDVGRVASRRRRRLGTGVFAGGAAMIVAAITVATTPLGVGALGRYGAREVAGILAGLGLPAVVLGVFVVLPASRTTRAAAGVGASLAVFGVALFRDAYPYAWIDTAPLYALGTTGVYFAGVATTFWCLFLALATFETRRDPGGTATMQITDEGRIRLVEESPSLPGVGGVGLLGSDPDGAVATQTNRPEGQSAEGVGREPADDGGVTVMGEDEGTAGQRGGSAGPDRGNSATAERVAGATADGGSTAVHSDPEGGPGTDGAEFLGTAAERGRPDAYCGNCAHFEYVKADGDIEPFCGYTATVMDDMDACEEWTRTD